MKKKNAIPAVLPSEHFVRQIYVIRSQRVMLDTDLAYLYGIKTFNLNKAVKRNIERFPEDFMFQLTEKEYENLRFQIGISNTKRGGRRHLPYAFTEHVVAMLSSVLRSERAVKMNIAIIRAFVQLRNLLATNKDLATRVEKLERTQKDHGSIIQILAEEIDALKLPPEPLKKRRIGYV